MCKAPDVQHTEIHYKIQHFFCNDIKLYTMDKGLKRDMLSTHTFTTICTLNDYRVSKIEATIEMQETSI